MKYNCIILSLLIIVLSCSTTGQKSGKLTLSQELASHDSTFDYSQLPLDSFVSYQTFNERIMEGEGIPHDTPFVYVKRGDSLILVKVSDNTDSLIIYKKWQRYWVNRHWENMEARDSFVCKHGLKAYATIYDRLIMNDTILELRREYVNEDFVESFFIRDANSVKVFNLINDIEDYSNPYSDMLRIMRYYSMHNSLTFCNPKYNVNRDDFIEYHVENNEDSLIFHSDNKTIVQKMNSLRGYNLFPNL